MATVISIQEFRRRTVPIAAASEAARKKSPLRICKDEIWAHDFSSLTGVVFGAMRVREILDHHFPLHEEWKHHLLCVLDICQRTQGRERANALAETIFDFKSCIYELTTPENAKDMALAVLVLELIERSAALRLHGSRA